MKSNYLIIRQRKRGEGKLDEEGKGRGGGMREDIFRKVKILLICEANSQHFGLV